MPNSTGFGKWPVEYGVGVVKDRETKLCALCTQKKCFKVNILFFNLFYL
jgi:hypothetical protein